MSDKRESTSVVELREKLRTSQKNANIKAGSMAFLKDPLESNDRYHAELIDSWLLRISSTVPPMKSYPYALGELDEEKALSSEEGRLQANEEFFRQTGDRIFELTDGEGARYYALFMQDHAKRWNSGLTHESSVMRREAPLLYACIHFFFDNRILALTIVLSVYFIFAQIIVWRFYDGYFGGVFQTIGVLAGVVLGAHVVKGGVFTPAFAAISRWVERRADKMRKSMAEEADSPLHASISGPGMGGDGAGSSAAGTGKKAPSAMTSSEAWAFFWSALWRDNVYTLRLHRREWTEQLRKVRGNGLVECFGFYEVLDLATEYLDQTSLESHGFVARPYTAWWLKAWLIIIPLFVISSWIQALVELARCSYNGHHGFNSSDPACNRQNFMALIYMGNTLHLTCFGLSLLSFVTTLGALLYGTDVAAALTRGWLYRFHSLRCVSDQSFEHRESLAAPAKTVVSKLDRDVLQPLIKRDAYERYLFMNAFFDQATKMWSFLLTATLLVTLALFADSYFVILYVWATAGRLIINYVILAIINALIFSFVFFALSYANSSIDQLLYGFTYAGAADYQVLGERSAWIDFVNSAPIYWYLFGYPITRSSVIAFIYGVVSTIVGALVMSAVVGG